MPLPDREGKPVSEGLMSIENIGLQEFIEHPFAKGSLTSDGVQYSAPATTSTVESIYATVLVATAMPPRMGGQIYELEFGLTAALRQESTASGTVLWQWQGRSLSSPSTGSQVAFRNLHAQDSSVFAAEATAYVEDTKSGRLNLNSALDRFPIELQLLVKSEDELDGVAKVKNSSYVKAVTSRLYRRVSD